MRKLFELNLDFNIWYKNQLVYSLKEPKIDRDSDEDVLYKMGFVVVFLISVVNLTLLLISPLFIISCIINFIYYFVKDYYEKKAEIKRIKELKIKIGAWIDYYESKVNQMTPLKLGNSVMSSYDLSRINPQDLNIEGFKHLFKEYDKKFILRFLRNINNEYYTVDSKTNKVTCRLGARRSIRDIYLVVKYYFPEITFEQVLEDIVWLYNEQFINGSFCSDVRLYIFYTDQISSARNSDRTLELSQELTFKDLINYFNSK